MGYRMRIAMGSKTGTLADELTAEALEHLRDEAAWAGDWMMLSIAELALHGEVLTDLDLSAEARATLASLDRQSARVECARVIADAMDMDTDTDNR